MICVDASLAIKWVLEEVDSDAAQAFLTDCTFAGERLVAPPLLPIEVTSILRQRMRRGDPPLLLADAVALLRQFLQLPVEIVGPVDLHELALELADSYSVASAYDAHYLALARMLECELWTADQRLVNAVGDAVLVRGIHGYSRTEPTD